MIEGFIEALRPFQVRGWAIDNANPAARLDVRVSVDGQAAGRAKANLFRADLVSARCGDGRHAFVVNVSVPLPLQRPASIVVEALSPDGSACQLPQLDGMAVEQVHIELSRPAETSVKGFFAASAFEVSGWAFDTASPDEHLRVVVESAGQVIGQARADLFKDDLVRAGIGTGDHGFSLSVPPGIGPLPPELVAAFALAADGRRIPLGIAVPPESKPVEPIAPDIGAADASHAIDAADILADLPPPPLPRVAIFPGESIDRDHRPVIVLGAARSGTSAMAQALAASGLYEGFEEGHFLDLLGSLQQATKQFYSSRSGEWVDGRSTHLAIVTMDFVEQGLRHMMVQAARASFPTGNWVDKTPRASMVALAPVMRAIWPQARFIYMRRRAIENLDSRLRKFPNMDFEAQCREWALSIRNWTAVVDQLSGAAMEIDQVYMASHATETAAELGRFLGLEPEATERVAQALAFDQPERTSSRFGGISDLAELGWTTQQREIFERVCAGAMADAGYDTGRNYFLNGNARKGLVIR